jgi:hypothetical protein
VASFRQNKNKIVFIKGFFLAVRVDWMLNWKGLRSSLKGAQIYIDALVHYGTNFSEVL